jgi:hypothetical protein
MGCASRATNRRQPVAARPAGLAPYLVTAGVVAQVGQARRLQIVSGSSLLILGAAVLLRQVV